MAFGGEINNGFYSTFVFGIVSSLGIEPDTFRTKTIHTVHTCQLFYNVLYESVLCIGCFPTDFDLQINKACVVCVDFRS